MVIRNAYHNHICQLSCDNNVKGECKLDIIEIKENTENICLSQDLTKINNK
jgi:hypothetical protein